MNGLAVCGILAGIIYFLLYNSLPLFFILIFLAGYFFLGHKFVPPNKYNSIRRKVQISSWSDPVRPLIFGYFPIKISKALAFVKKWSTETGENITLTHLIFKAIGDVIKDCSDVNGKIVLGNYINYKTVDACLLVDLEEGNDVYFVNISDIANKPLSVIAREVKEKAESIRTGKEKEKYSQAKANFQSLPTCVIAVLLEIISFVTCSLGIPINFLNLKANCFGAFTVTSVGMHDLQVGYPPLVPTFRNPATFCPTTVRDVPVVENSVVVVEKMLNLCCVVDHRFIDGMRAINIQNKIKDIIENPEQFIKV